MSHTWSRRNTFQLVSHGNKGRPCMTISSPESGKPCIFPFSYPDCNLDHPAKRCSLRGVEPPQLHYKCYPEGGSSWCSTRIHWNDSHITGQFGSCSPSCGDNSTEQEDLASQEFDNLWDEGFYRLFKDEFGYCHTYNPDHQSSAAPDQRLVALLGREPHTLPADNHDIYY